MSLRLVEQYFGTRERLIAAVIQSEIEDFAKRFSVMPAKGAEPVLESVRKTLKTGQARFHDYALLVTRAQLAGVKPEKMLDPATPTPAMALATAIRELQAGTPGTAADRMDPFLVSAYINAVLFAFETIAPWLMASVGLKAEDYEARHDEIVDISVKLVALAAGSGPEADRGPNRRRRVTVGSSVRGTKTGASHGPSSSRRGGETVTEDDARWRCGPVPEIRPRPRPGREEGQAWSTLIRRRGQHEQHTHHDALHGNRSARLRHCTLRGRQPRKKAGGTLLPA